jgi:hypothetical protein
LHPFHLPVRRMKKNNIFSFRASSPGKGARGARGATGAIRTGIFVLRAQLPSHASQDRMVSVEYLSVFYPRNRCLNRSPEKST